VSRLAWGMWRFTGDATSARALVDAALGAGITLFDTADIYGIDGAGFGAAEALLGDLLAADTGLRDRIVLATKGGIDPGVPYDSGSSYLAAAIDASLRRLRTDRVDLYQIHRPDVLTHPAEVARTLADAHDAGKIGAVGVSNYTVAQIDALRAHLPGSLPLVATQPEFSALELTPLIDGQLDQAMRCDLTVLAWSPLGGGRIASPTSPREHAVAAALDDVAAAHGVSRTVAAYAWIMAYPAAPIPIVGSQQPARIAEAARALDVELTRTQWYAVLTASRGEKLP
jgi:predicted oxidoreductase